MKVGLEWYGDEGGHGSKEHVVWTEMDQVPFPGDILHFANDEMAPKRVIRRRWVENEKGKWHVELVLR